MKIKTRKYGQIDAKVQTMLNRVYYNGNNSGVVALDERYVKDEDGNKTLVVSGTVLLQGYMVKGRWELPFTPTPTLRSIYLICDFDNDNTYLSFDDVINTGDPLTQTGVLSYDTLQILDSSTAYTSARHNTQGFNSSITRIDLKSYLNKINFNVSSCTVYAYVIHPNIIKVMFNLVHAINVTTNSIPVFDGTYGVVLPSNLRPNIICSSVAFNSKYNKLFEIRVTTTGTLDIYVYADRALNTSTTTGTIYLYRGAV